MQSDFMDFFIDGLEREDCDTIAELFVAEAKEGKLTPGELIRCEGGNKFTAHFSEMIESGMV